MILGFCSLPVCYTFLLSPVAAVHQGARQQRHVHSTLKDELLLFLMLAPCCRYTSLLTAPKISSWSRQLHMMKPLILVVYHTLSNRTKNRKIKFHNSILHIFQKYGHLLHSALALGFLSNKFLSVEFVQDMHCA
ncbi:uncharacterized protein [Aegilops tauschii subsp. strangulata]|uniref:uncharacterized protein isoform X3 n=1 Tax=Aegilops tauschii subsp. strangulata TaxID=200361 RepID=UPI001ABBFA09